eukprot:gene1737-biopygen9402
MPNSGPRDSRWKARLLSDSIRNIGTPQRAWFNENAFLRRTEKQTTEPNTELKKRTPPPRHPPARRLPTDAPKSPAAPPKAKVPPARPEHPRPPNSRREERRRPRPASDRLRRKLLNCVWCIPFVAPATKFPGLTPTPT